jgi:serine/threonine-protein kinase RsbW
MGQLRSAVRAVTGPEVSPAQLLERLDSFVEQVEAASMATLAYAELDLATGHVRYACAGHPPPVHVPAEGPPRLLWGGRSTPLGAYTRPHKRYDAQLRLSPGDRLVLYTDGLVERRGRAIDEGLELVAERAGELRDVPLEEAVNALTETLLEDEQGRDDVCVLLLSWAGSPFERHLRADVTQLPSVRRALGRWLADLGVDAGTSRDIVLAASEAMANAAEHGGGGDDEEQVSIEARLEQHDEGLDEVVVSVRDRGRWRDPVPSHERGRGLLIMRGLVDDVRVEAGDSAGTTVVLRRRLRREAS